MPDQAERWPIARVGALRRAAGYGTDKTQMRTAEQVHAGGHIRPTEELLANIAANGVLEPLEVRGDCLVEGMHRYATARLLGLEYLPVIRVET